MPGSRDTVFSPCRRYRYTLWRDFGGLVGSGYAMFIGLNPSTADEANDDPTIRRCIAFSKAWGFSAYCMTNLFAFRATDPKVMFAEEEPVGADNDDYLAQMAAGAGIVVAAWGVHGTHRGRDQEVVRKISNLHCLRVTKAGNPAHPLYLPGGLTPIPYQPIAGGPVRIDKK